MADAKVPTTGLKSSLPKIPNVDEILPNEKVWEYQRRVKQAQINKGSRYPPFSIEHLPWERQRLAEPMTDADRFLRRQWLRDQNLSLNEPRVVPESVPMFKTRRLWRLPWDTVEKFLTKIIGRTPAYTIRTVVPKFLIGYVAFLGVYYHMTYNPKSWESHHGISVYGARRPIVPGEDNSGIPADPEVHSLRGFNKRTSHFNARTSAQGQ